jgi:hypothetical protein
VPKSSSVLFSRPNRLTSAENVCAVALLLGPILIAIQVEQRLEAENAALRRQLIVLQRKVRGRVHFTNSDRSLPLRSAAAVGSS